MPPSTQHQDLSSSEPSAELSDQRVAEPERLFANRKRWIGQIAIALLLATLWIAITAQPTV